MSISSSRSPRNSPKGSPRETSDFYPSIIDDEVRDDVESPEPSTVGGMDPNVALSVVDSNLGDLEELSNDISQMSVYAMRPDHLASWSNKIRRVIKGVRESLPAAQSNKRFASNRSTTVADFGSVAEGSTSIHTVVPSQGLRTITPFVAGSIYLLLDALQQTLSAEWCTCFLCSSKHNELILASSVGARTDKPGTFRLSATSGIESHVLASGIAVNVTHAYAEEEFSGEQDRGFSRRTRAELVFPLIKPGSTNTVMGIIQVCNKQNGKDVFEGEDENRAAECAHFISALLSRFPCDLVSGTYFDVNLLQSCVPTQAKKPFGDNFPLIDAAQRRHPVLIFRTARAGHVARSDLVKDATKLPVVPTITEAIGHITKVNDGWRNAVLLNIELEREITRLREGMKVSKRENARLSSIISDLRKQLETTEAMLETYKSRRQSAFVPQ